VIARFWHERLSALPAGARVLDIATGNGALPRLLLDACPDAAVVCDAVDLAAIQPAWLADLPGTQRARLRFHGGCAAEALPFGDGSFDLVVSQYGLEYSDLERSLPEVRRVLAPGGRIAFVMHHAEARPVQLAAIEIDHIEWLLAPGGLLDTARQLLPAMAQAGSAEGRAVLARDARANALRDDFNMLQRQMDARAAATGGDGADVLDEARQATAGLFALAAQQGAAAALQAWQGTQQWLQDAALRLRELRAHALDAGGLQAVADALAPATGRLQIGTLVERQHLMGWALHGPTGGR
jgi:ubiquinone/menaquinone biosynthesis C-methylase UbiE